ncbi:MAG: hypothetical protein FWC76_08270, partial [Defluviitaleaceae bacterium]|nr:hypothetical protein [Defluviitaleaceae bacterium]
AARLSYRRTTYSMYYVTAYAGGYKPPLRICTTRRTVKQNLNTNVGAAYSRPYMKRHLYATTFAAFH